MTWWMIVLAVLALALGVWIGLGAPGWPQQKPLPGAGRRKLEKRPLNPIAWMRRETGSDRRRRRR